MTTEDTIVGYEPLWSAITTFHLAKRLVQFQMYAENNWCGGTAETFDEPLPDNFILQKDEMKRLLAKLREQVRDQVLQDKISLVSELLESAWQDFLQAFHGDERHRKIERLEICEPDDPNFDTGRYLLRGWPLNKQPWSRFVEALSRLLKMLPDADRLCYQLSHTISFGVYLHATNPHGRSDRLPPGSYLSTRFAPKLRKWEERLAVRIGRLKKLDFDVSEDAYSRSNHRVRGYSDWVYGKLETLNKRLPQLIEDAAVKHDEQWGIDRPFWDEEAKELRYQGQVIKQFRNEATSQIPIIRAFQRAGWPKRIEAPTIRTNSSLTLQGRHQRRRLDAIRDLNYGIRQKALKFSGDRTGKGVQWEPCDKVTTSEDGLC